MELVQFNYYNRIIVQKERKNIKEKFNSFSNTLLFCLCNNLVQFLLFCQNINKFKRRVKF